MIREQGVEVRPGQIWIHRETEEGWRVLRTDPVGVWLRSTQDDTRSRRVYRDSRGEPAGFREPVMYCEYCGDGVPWPFSIAGAHLEQEHPTELAELQAALSQTGGPDGGGS